MFIYLHLVVQNKPHLHQIRDTVEASVSAIWCRTAESNNPRDKSVHPEDTFYWFQFGKLTIVHAEENHGGIWGGFGAQGQKKLIYCRICLCDLSTLYAFNWTCKKYKQTHKTKNKTNEKTKQDQLQDMKSNSLAGSCVCACVFMNPQSYEVNSIPVGWDLVPR